MTVSGNVTSGATLASRRRGALRQAGGSRTAALLVSKPEDVRYLSGFTGDDSFLLLGGGWATLITDGRYAEQARSECRDIDVHVRTGPVSASLPGLLKGRRARSVMVQAEHVAVGSRQALADALAPRKVKAVANVTASLREVKGATEVRAIARAVRIAQAGLRGLLARGMRGLVGRSERDVAAELDYRMRLGGADAPSFETIVAAGAHTSLPHYRPGATRIRRDRCLLIDWGARAGGYCSDLTRTLLLGKIPPKLAEIYKVVLRAQAAGIAACRPGVSTCTVDAAARKIIEDAGFGPQFVHGLGHGIGLEVHEGPGLGRTAAARLRSGMVVTVEPGIYLPGVGGVRIEDDILIVPGGARRLSSLPRSQAAMSLPRRPRR